MQRSREFRERRVGLSEPRKNEEGDKELRGVGNGERKTEVGVEETRSWRGYLGARRETGGKRRKKKNEVR